MTRGKMVLIEDDGILSSIEFNGDMYIDGGYGEEVIQGLVNVHTVGEYKAFVEKFNKEHHNYDDDVLVFDYLEDGEDESELFNMAVGYFDKWFSDYLYIKNLRDEDFTLTTKDYKTVTISAGGVCALYFGHYDDDCSKVGSGVTLDVAQKLIDICEELGWWVNVGDTDVEIGKSSPAGEDFFFTVGKRTFVKDVREYAGNFDADEHAEMWLESRGKGGCPSSIRQLIDDADAIAEMLDDLAMAFKDYDDEY